MLIGLGYAARSGKDTVASILASEFGFKRVAFADALKGACAEVFGLDDAQLHGKDKEVLDPFWNVTPREILQRVGTECFRNGYAQDVWIRALKRRIAVRLGGGLHTVVSDVRFPNEAQAILDWGGYPVLVERPGAGATGGIEGHASETSLTHWTGWAASILNNGSLAQLRETTVELFDLLTARSRR
jgi:hypothetical protein